MTYRHTYSVPTQPGLTQLCPNKVRVNSVDWQLASNVFNFDSCQLRWLKFFIWNRVNSVVPQHSEGQLNCSLTQLGSTQLFSNTVRVNLVDWQLASNVFNFNTCQLRWLKFFMWTRVNSVVPQHSQGQLSCSPTQSGSTQLTGS